MMRARRRLVRATRLTATEWRDLLRATVELARARRALPLIDPRALVATTRTATEAPASDTPPSNARPSDTPPSDAPAVLVARVAWAVPAAASVVPWRSDCLVQALAARRWLAAAGIPTELHLGVARDEGFAAHAWLICRDQVVTGGDPRHFAVFTQVR